MGWIKKMHVHVYSHTQQNIIEPEKRKSAIHCNIDEVGHYAKGNEPTTIR